MYFNDMNFALGPMFAAFSGAGSAPSGYAPEIFQSSVLYPYYLVPRFPLPHFPLPRFQRPRRRALRCVASRQSPARTTRQTFNSRQQSFHSRWSPYLEHPARRDDISTVTDELLSTSWLFR